jgi:pimeloyl-ACP methyl ester carboxylesterase
MNQDVECYYGVEPGVAQGRAPVAPGVELYYETRGSGPPVVLLNNFFMLAPFWRALTPRLPDDHLVVGYDLRNQGLSSCPGADIAPGDHIDDLIRLLDHLGIERATIMGASASTLIARDAAIAHPDRVDALVLAGPIFNATGGARRRRLLRSWLSSLAAGGPAGLFNHIYPLIFTEQTIESGGSAAYLAVREIFLVVVTAEQAGGNLTASLKMSDDPARLRDIRCPTLVITGEADFLTSPSSLEAVAALVPDCTVTVLPFTGHAPYYEANEEFEAGVGRFLAGLRTPAGAP